MQVPHFIEVNQFLLFTLVVARLSGLILVMPVLGARDVPMRIRAMLVLAMALVIAPTQAAAQLVHPATVIDLGIALLGELLVGLALGLGVLILFLAIELAGQIIGQVSGMAMAQVFNPLAEAQLSVFSQFLSLLTVAVFVTIGGHRIVMTGLLQTFAEIPLGAGGITASTTDSIATLLAQSYELAIRFAAPSLTAQLLSTIVLGLISRTLPQLNILAVGFGLKSMIAMATLVVSLGGMAWMLEDQLSATVDAMLNAVNVLSLEGPLFGGPRGS